MENIPGFWEHIAMVWDGLKQARQQNRDIGTAWLDIENAYGSIPHQLIFFSLHRCGKSKPWLDKIRFYYFGLCSKSCSETAPSSWHQHMIGIFTGCTLSIILFLCGMNIIIEYALQVDFEGFFCVI